MKNLKIPTKTRAEIEQEITDVMSGKKRTPGAFMVRQFVKTRKLMGETDEFIHMQLVKEYIIKYGELKSGKKDLKQLEKESLQDVRSAKRLAKN